MREMEGQTERRPQEQKTKKATKRRTEDREGLTVLEGKKRDEPVRKEGEERTERRTDRK